MLRPPSLRRLRLSTALLGVVLAACASPAGSPSASATPAPSPSVPVLSLSGLDAQPIEHRAEEVALAFDPATAAELLEEVPADLDFDQDAVVCVFLGPRQTTGWSLDLRSASLSGREVEIRARENAPRTETRPEVTYPADCGLLTRAALPAGELVVRADDTVSGEFIADTTVVVPEASNAP